MRGAYMSIQTGITTCSEEMTLVANIELGNFGPCRRR